MNLTMMRVLFETAMWLGGIMLMGLAGATAWAVVEDEWAAAAAMVLAAGALATKGRTQAQRWWELLVLGEIDPYGEASANYEHTTRARALAPKLERLVKRATKPITIRVVGTEHDGSASGAGRFDEALEKAAQAGADITVFVAQWDEAGTRRMQALTQRHANAQCIVMETETMPDAWWALHPVIAWSGELDEPEHALFWLETVVEEDECETSAEYRGTRNLRKNAGMLRDFDEDVRAVLATLGQRGKTGDTQGGTAH